MASLLFMAGEAIGQVPFFRDEQFQKVNATAQITSLAQDTKGHIWLGTTQGLYRYDGFEFKPATGVNYPVDDGIRSVCALRSGEVLAGTESGRLILTNDVSGRLLKPTGYLTGFAVSDIIQVSSNEIWVSTYGNGIYRIQDNVATHFTMKNGLPDNFVYCLTNDANGRIWAGTDNGLVCVFKLGSEYRTRSYGTTNGLPDNIVKVVEVGPTGDIWVGTFEQGIAILDENAGRFKVPRGLQNWNYGHLNCMILMENEFWMGSDKFGILDYEFAALGRFRFFGPEFLYGLKSVDALLTDNANNVWIASGNSLLFTPGERIEFINDACGSPMGNIRAILSDSKGRVWAGTGTGVIRFFSDSLGTTVCDRPLDQTSFRDVQVISFHEDKYNRIWLGTFDHGVLVYTPETGQIINLSEADGLINGSVLSICGSGETIWLGTLGGVTGCYYPPKFSGKKAPQFFSLPGRGPGTNFIYKVFEDSQKRLLAGTDGDGLGIFDGKLYSSYGKQHGLKSGVIYSITEDRKGGIWVAASEGGLYRFHDRSIKNYNRESGLSDLAISALTTDSDGNIIVINKTGIDVMDPETGHLISLGEEVGIKSIDPELNCLSNDHYGNTWIGTRNGIIKIRMGQRASAMVPSLHLDKVYCFLEEIDTTLDKQFAYNRNHISFEYSGIWYDDPEAVTFRYRLEGYNTSWVVTRDRLITFPNLSPGNYTFRVMASLNGNFAEARESTYSFTITAPFWNRPWFMTILILALAGSMIVYIRHRDNKTRSMEALNKERISAQFEVLRNQVNPHFLFNSFNTLISIIEDDQAKAIDYVNKLSDFFRRILTHKEKNLIPLQEELGLLEDYLYLQKQRYGDGFVMDVKLPAQSELEKIAVPPLSLQMLVENAFKHNAVNVRNPLRIEIFVNESGNLVIRNNKIKRVTSEPSTGTGLVNLSNRFKLLSGQEPLIHDNFDSFTVILPVIRYS